MADRSLAIRLAVIDGGKVKAELRDVGDAGSRSLRRIEDAARPASRALQALDGVAGEVRGGLEAMSGRLGAVGSALARLGPLGLAAGAALAGVGIAVSKGIEEAAKADQSYRRLEAVLKATGFAAGLTAKEISSFADGIEASTLATAEAVQDAASILATFRSVSGETFTRALTLAQDLAAVFGQDLASAATQLGKALEDPIAGLAALRRVGISFSDSQRELIKTLVETGQTAEAQRVILDALERQVGGAGAAEAGGLTGATNRLQDAWDNLLEAIGRTPAVTGIAQGALTLLSGAIENLTTLFEDDPIGGQAEAAKARLTQARDELSRLESAGPGTPLLGQRFDLDAQRQRVAALEKELDALTRIGEAEAKATEAEKARAEAGRRAAEAERRTEALATQSREIDKALERLATPSEKIAAVNRELAETKKRLEALRASDAGNSPAVDAALAAAEDLARRRIAALQPRPARTAENTAGRAVRADREVIDRLARDLATVADDRRRFVDQTLARLSEGATAGQRTEAEQLANRLYDEREARERLAETMRREQHLREEGKRLIEATATPAEQLVETIAHLDELMRAGAIDAVTHGRAVAEAYADAGAGLDRMLAASGEWTDGIRRALRDYTAEAGDAVRQFERVTSSALRASEDAFVQWARTGKISATDLFNTIAEEALRTAYRMLVLKPLSGFLEGLLGNVSFDLFGGGSGVYGASPLHNSAFGLLGHAHKGGMVGGPNAFETRPVALAAFAGAPRFHGGGLVGAGEVPIVAKEGEVIGWPEQMRRAFGSEVVVQIIDQRSSGAQPEVSRERGPDGRQLIRVLIREEVGRGLAQGWWDQTMGSAYGLNRRGVPR